MAIRLRGVVDVVIVGGGPAGLAAAIASRRRGLSVIVLERTDYRARRIGEHLSPGAKPLLESLALADLILGDGHAPCPGVQSVWGSGKTVDHSYIFNPHGEGVNLTRPRFDLDLLRRVEQLDGVVYPQAIVLSLVRSSGSWLFRVRQGQAEIDIRGRVLIDATGRNAWIARRLGGRLLVYDSLVALYDYCQATDPNNKQVLVEALEDGWWYSAGLADGSVVTTFMTDLQSIRKSRTSRRGYWAAQLAMAAMTSARVAAPSQPEMDVRVRVAQTQRMDVPIGDMWIATGDAAMAYDPLSSEGISKAFDWGIRSAMVAESFCRGNYSLAQAYSDDMSKAFAAYLVKRYSYYSAERRWPHSAFWQRRLQPPSYFPE